MTGELRIRSQQDVDDGYLAWAEDDAGTQLCHEHAPREVDARLRVLHALEADGLEVRRAAP